MSIAIALILVAVAALLFHLLSPWWYTEAASNWGAIDESTNFTLLITGVIFIVINLSVAYVVVRFRYKKNKQAEYQPHNKKPKNWLIRSATIFIVVTLAPGMAVYFGFVNPPDNTSIIEVVGEQWRWSFRFPGKDGKLGNSLPRFVSDINPFGLNPNDLESQDDILVHSNNLHLPLNLPVKLLFRSKDVLHDFYLPQIRAKMDLVPGATTGIWFTPSKIGSYEILCAEFCGVGYANMRGRLTIETEFEFNAWLNAQPSFLQSRLQQQSMSTGSQPLIN